jgi:hypothetical protein
MSRRKTQFPPYTQNFRDRHGEFRSYFRRGSVRVSLPSPVLGEAYWAAYDEANAAYVDGRQPGALRDRIEADAARNRRPCFRGLYGIGQLPERFGRKHAEDALQHSGSLAGSVGRSPIQAATAPPRRRVAQRARRYARVRSVLKSAAPHDGILRVDRSTRGRPDRRCEGAIRQEQRLSYLDR